jgi:hypothetical protein
MKMVQKIFSQTLEFDFLPPEGDFADRNRRKIKAYLIVRGCRSGSTTSEWPE